MNIFALRLNLNPKLNIHYSLWSPIDAQVTQISPPHQILVIASRAQMGAQVIHIYSPHH